MTPNISPATKQARINDGRAIVAYMAAHQLNQRSSGAALGINPSRASQCVRLYKEALRQDNDCKRFKQAVAYVQDGHPIHTAAVKFMVNETELCKALSAAPAKPKHITYH